jgi:hypothetical protein
MEPENEMRKNFDDEVPESDDSSDDMMLELTITIQETETEIQEAQKYHYDCGNANGNGNGNAGSAKGGILTTCRFKFLGFRSKRKLLHYSAGIGISLLSKYIGLFLQIFSSFEIFSLTFFNFCNQKNVRKN